MFHTLDVYTIRELVAHSYSYIFTYLHLVVLESEHRLAGSILPKCYRPWIVCIQQLDFGLRMDIMVVTFSIICTCCMSTVNQL